ncbi:MAG TPA: hypothetical protein VFL83_01440 [Anaeromyxobacter sp.]|nr:hypothetical protein [Anaeromyxobacter sp.]
MKKTAAAVLFTLVAASAAYLAFSTAPAEAAPAPAAQGKYTATVFVAGHGGHFAKADVVVDPSDAENPIKVQSLDQVEIGTTETHKTHDARLDGDTLFWSTYALDKEGKLHVGKSDAKTGKVLKDVAFAPDARAPMKAGPAYCASGQSKNAFMPVFMGSEGYVDVWDKKTLELKHRVFVSDLGYKPGTYQFVHGSNSRDMKRFIVTVTLKGEDGKMTGKQDVILVDLPALEKGKWKELARVTLAGEPGKTIAFRQYFTTDDKLVYQAAGDRMWLLDAKTLKLVDEKMTQPAGENHDVQPTPDGKYALLTLRTSDTPSCDEKGNPIPDKKITDGALMLYDASARKLVGKPASVCFGCHKDAGKGDKNAILCGLATRFGK